MINCTDKKIFMNISNPYPYYLRIFVAYKAKNICIKNVGTKTNFISLRSLSVARNLRH